MQTTTLGALVEKIKQRMNDTGFDIRSVLTPQHYYLASPSVRIGSIRALSTIRNIESSTGKLGTYLVSASNDINNRYRTWSSELSENTVLVQIPHLPRKLLLHLEDGNWGKTQTLETLHQPPNRGGKYRFHGEFEPLPLLGARLEVKYYNTLTERPLVLAAYVKCKDIQEAERVITNWVANGAETILTYGHLSVPSLDTIYTARRVSGWVQTMTASKFYPE